EKKVDLHAWIKIRATVLEEEELVTKLIDTTAGRVLFNQVVPEEVGYINELLTKKSLRDIIGNILKVAGVTKAAKFLDDIKELGFMSAFKGGLSFNLNDIIVPEEKDALVKDGYAQVDEVMNNYNSGFITNNERYNQIIDIWTHTNSKLTQTLMKQLTEDKGGFNSVFMMLDSGARGSKEQIRQLSGMRGLMAKPQKSGATGGEIIENPILANFKEGLSILEYFISTHGARKGLADTALKTADAGYLTRRLVDVAQDVVIAEDDCGTLMSLIMSDLKNNDELVESLYDRILGRTCSQDILHPESGDLLASAGDELDEKICELIASSPIETVEIRSALACESRLGVCAKCYGRNLSTGRKVQIGEAVGVIAAQSIGEPGTQLTLRTFHVGGAAASIAAESKVDARHDGILEIDELRVVKTTNTAGEKVNVVIGRSAEMRISHPETKIVLSTTNIPYGAEIYKKHGDKVKVGDPICAWDPFNAVIISETAGKVEFEDIQEGVTYRVEMDEQTGFKEKVISERRDRTKNPMVKIISGKKQVLKSYNIPVNAHIIVNDNENIEAGKILVKIPRLAGKTGDITGGLPRVTELFEARNPSNPAVVSEIDGVVEFGKIKRGNQEILVESKTGEVKKYMVSLSKHILVQENDYIRAGMPLSDGAITPADILAIQGPTAVQTYIVNEVQEVYRLQGVKINDKHYEVIVRQMMRKVFIEDAGDTRFLEKQIVDRFDFSEENDWIFGKKIIEESGDSATLRSGQIVNVRKLRDEVSVLKRKDKNLPKYRDAIAAISSPVLQGITRASLRVKSFISAASFQETTKVLNEASIQGKQDHLKGLKENVIVGHKIPAGTGLPEYYEMIVGSQEEYDKLVGGKGEEAKDEEIKEAEAIEAK
ncbi:MAG TPA: DNA-directed RNA polymerase subunit beta', partial [Flavobacteriales bacterium]|nr:DNA-directed RNA polymerase subunit beta' [Flavobacteriales bacterium]